MRLVSLSETLLRFGEDLSVGARVCRHVRPAKMCMAGHRRADRGMMSKPACIDMLGFIGVALFEVLLSRSASCLEFFSRRLYCAAALVRSFVLESRRACSP